MTRVNKESEVGDPLVLDQEAYEELPDVPAGNAIMFFDTTWQKAELEAAASSLIQVCARRGLWSPVEYDVWAAEALAHNRAFRFASGAYTDGLFGLLETEDIYLFKRDGVMYVVPMPSLAEKAFSGKVRLASTFVQPPSQRVIN
jgi:hypothetical protein